MILDENLFQDYRKPLKESAEAVKRILQPRVTERGIKPFGKNERLPRGFRFKSSSGTNGEVTYNGRDYVYAIKNGEVRVMDSSKAGHNWSETIYKESINKSKSINEDKSIDKLKFKDTKYEGSRTATFSKCDDLSIKENWCNDKLDELVNKPKSEWTQDDYEAYFYCKNATAERDYYDSYDKSLNDTTDMNNSLEEDWSKGLSFTFKITTNSLQNAFKNGSVRVGGQNKADLSSMYGDTSLRFKIVDKPYSWANDGYMNVDRNESELRVNLYDKDFTYKDIGGKSNFNKAKLTQEMEELKNSIENDLKDAGLVITQSKVEVGGSPKFDTAWRQAQKYNEDLDLSNDEDFDTYSKFNSDLYNAMSDVVYDYSSKGISKKDIEKAVEWFLTHFFDDYEEDEFLGESKSINEAARNKNSHKYFALMSYDFDPESGPDADRFSVSDVGQFSSKKEAEDNWRDILSKDRWAYVTEISEDEYNDHQELIKFYNEHPGYMDYEYCTKVVNQFKDALRSKDLEGARAARKELSSIGYSNEEISAIKKEVLKEAFNADRVKKRIACTTEFDNGHVFYNYFRASSAEAEEMARQKSIENPGKVFYVKYDNVMEPCSDIKWKNGQKINEYTENLDKDAVFTKNRYDDKIYYHGFMDKKDADRHYPDRLKTKTYWYSTRHGVMPGSVPKGINILDVRDIGNKSYFKTDSIISSKDLKYYDIKEDIPPMEESKRSLKKHSKLLKENAYIKTYKLGDPEFENLYKLADILTKKSPNKYVYYVGDTYFDLGQNWMWTTVLCRGDWSSYQALNPREQEEAILANSDAELEKIADSVLSDKYCPDKKRISEDAIADKIKANQDTKEMTKRAIQILKKKGAEYKDLEKDYEKIYGDKLIFDEK